MRSCTKRKNWSAEGNGNKEVILDKEAVWLLQGHFLLGDGRGLSADCLIIVDEAIPVWLVSDSINLVLGWWRGTSHKRFYLRLVILFLIPQHPFLLSTVYHTTIICKVTFNIRVFRIFFLVFVFLIFICLFVLSCTDSHLL